MSSWAGKIVATMAWMTSALTSAPCRNRRPSLWSVPGWWPEDYCGGGSPSNKLYENGRVVSTETMFCRLAQQVLLDETLETIEAEGVA